jgi:hypothetical protein
MDLDGGVIHNEAKQLQYIPYASDSICLSNSDPLVMLWFWDSLAVFVDVSH